MKRPFGYIPGGLFYYSVVLLIIFYKQKNTGA